MLNTPRCRNGMVTSPHHLASQTGLQILRDGGTAIEAAVAMAAAVAVVYPHMTGIGGDGFWLIAEPGQPPLAVDACGAAGAEVSLDLYRRQGLSAIPNRGPLAANTVAGTISGWQAVLEINRRWGGTLPLSRLLGQAIDYAEAGIVVTVSQAELTAEKFDELAQVPGFADVYLPGGKAPAEGSLLVQPALAKTLRHLAEQGLDSFYRGPLAAVIAAELQKAGSPITAADLARHQPLVRQPLSVSVRGAELFNFPPPTQGLSSLMILALFDRLNIRDGEGFEYVHGLVEATKQAFLVRDREIADPADMAVDPASFLTPSALDGLAACIDRARALPWPAPASGGDTIWLGVIDGQGRSVSFIQSVYFEFGSGVVLPQTGITWQNRGCSFQLTDTGRRRLRPGAKPFHTLNPAMARFADGRSMVYGTMGGEGQPQTQAAVFSRYAWFGHGLQAAITAPRWLLGRTWGAESVTLKLESRFDAALVAKLRAAGHDVEILPPFTSTMGHAGAIVRHPNGVLEGATDPRSDGAASGW
jgi:gamma-glutamyltranspeptidase